MCQEVKKVMGSWQYDETDFERLSLIMMLYGLDFTVEEIKKYMKLSLKKNENECLKLLNKKRKGIFHPFLLTPPGGQEPVPLVTF